MSDQGQCEDCKRVVVCPEHVAQSYADQYAERDTPRWQRLYEAKIRAGKEL